MEQKHVSTVNQLLSIPGNLPASSIRPGLRFAEVVKTQGQDETATDAESIHKDY